MNRTFALALRGFVFGAGFAVACALVYVVAREALVLGTGDSPGVAPARATAAAPLASPMPVASPATQLVVASQRLERRHGDNVVIGVLHNNSSTTVRSVRVEATHHDATGRLVDVCGWYVGTSIAPGEDKAFKVSCGGTPERPSPESASARLRLVEGY